MMADFYSNFPTQSFVNSVNKATDTLNQIGTGKVSGEAYRQVVRQLWAFAQKNAASFGFVSHQQVRYAVAAMTQERGDNAASDLLSVLIQCGKFSRLLNELLIFRQEGWDKQAEQVRLCPKLLHLYYQRYFSFEAGTGNASARQALLEPLNVMLRLYSGRNRMVLLAKNQTDLIAGSLTKILRGFPPTKTLDEIRADLILSNNHEIFQRLRLLHMLTQIRALIANQYDAQVKRLFADVKQYPHVWANTQRLMLEECVREMLLKCQQKQQVGANWQQFIFETIGDPRASKHTQAWQRVGTELHQWYRGILSRGDLREFLETMTDGQGDEIYKYRKQFWLQYVDYAVNAKIMLGRTALGRLRRLSPDMYQRFIDSPETYSQLDEAERSCVFIDFGAFCVIEATHSGKWRIYRSTPINLSDCHYNYEQFHNLSAKLLLIEEGAHFYPEEYSWQNKVRRLLNQGVTPAVALQDVLLDEDKKPQKIALIRDYLLRNGQNPN
ncbi:MAG: EH signature domain-containing protein [Formosimonas sp.]